MKINFGHSYMLLILFLVSVLFSCADKIPQNLSYYENGEIKKLTIFNNDKKNQKTEYSFYENGVIESIHRFNHRGLLEGEQLWFYSDGTLDRKILYLNNKTQDMDTFFTIRRVH